MTYTEAIQESLKVEWVINTCSQGEKCWCRTVKCKTPIMFMDGECEEEYFVIRSGELGKDTVEYIVNLHNQNLKQ